MPYYVHPKDVILVDIDPAADALDAFTSYETRAEAHQHTPAGHTVTFVLTSGEASTWRYRERTRFSEGEYLAVPWADLSLYNGAFPRWVRRVSMDTVSGTDPRVFHFAHLSNKSPGCIAYTETDEKGIADRQTIVKPGRYLLQYFADDMTSTEIQEFIAQCSATYLELKIARSTEDVVRIYRNGGPRSCMSPGPSIDVHPCSVYGNSDLGIAYFGDIDNVSARGVVWPDKQLYGRLYGSGEVLRRLLISAGYTEGSMSGARVRRIQYDNYSQKIIMPYVDGVSYADPTHDGKYLCLGEGDVDCTETGGVVDLYGEDSDNEENDTVRQCDHCDREYDTETEGDADHCQDCFDARFTCDHCDQTRFSDSHDVDGDTWCDHCYSEALKTCADDTCDVEFIEQSVFTTEETAERVRRGVDDLCRDCAAKYVHCEVCDASYSLRDSDTCPTCDRLIAVDKLTADLLADTTADDNSQSTSTGGVWWHMRRETHTSRSYWFHDGVRGWYTNVTSAWQLYPSTFETLDDSDCYIRCADPRPRQYPNGAIVTDLLAVDGSRLAYTTEGIEHAAF